MTSWDMRTSAFLSSKRGLVPANTFPERLPEYYNEWEEVSENLALHYTNLRLRHVVDNMPVLRADSGIARRQLSRACLCFVVNVISCLLVCAFLSAFARLADAIA